MKIFKRFCADEVGAVTVDWVVLTAAVIGLGAAVLASVSTGVMSIAGTTTTTFIEMDTRSFASSDPNS